MFKKTIKLEGKEIPVKFGSWVVGQLIESGMSLQEIEKSVQENPFKFIALIAFLGACNADNFEDSDYKLNQFYGWIDDVGGVNSDEVVDVLNLFVKSISQNVPTEEKGNVKSLPNRAKK